jgi:hypothetical protein
MPASTSFDCFFRLMQIEIGLQPRNSLLNNVHC